jgi:tetratricopeptide (TPR) repeat protein
VLALATSLVWAGEDPKQEAKARYTTGQSHYNLNEFQDALREFKEAYRLYPDPAFLFNAAQCERQLGHSEEAIQFYRSYLRNAPKAPNRQEVEHRIEELQGNLEAKKAAAPAVVETPAVPAPPTSPPEPEAAPSVAANPAEKQEAPAPVVPSASPVVPVGESERPPSVLPEQRPELVSEPSKTDNPTGTSFYQRWWFWTGVGIAAAGIGLGVYVLSGSKSSPAPSSHLGTKTVF